MPKEFNYDVDPEESAEYRRIKQTITRYDEYDGSPKLQSLARARDAFLEQRKQHYKKATQTFLARWSGETVAYLEAFSERMEKDHQKELGALTKEADKAEKAAAEYRVYADGVVAKHQRDMRDQAAVENINESVRLEHTVIVAGSGHGKTQLLQSIILKDLKQDDPPCLIILDSTGQMVDRIQRLAVFNGRLRDRLVIIDPAHSPALNMFDIFTPRFENYTADEKEDMQGEVIGLFNYIFSSDDYDLTSRMGTLFSYAVRLILARKGSTITDLRRLLEEPSVKDQRDGYSKSAYKDEIDQLDEGARDFFKNHFFSVAFAGTRSAIAQRLHKVVGVPAFRRMFTAARNGLDLFADMQRGAIICVNTNQQLLKEDAYVLFGRYMIARVLAAAFERATVPKDQRKPAYLIIDEAAPYFDKNFESLLTRVRQFRLGVVIAFQHLEQASDKLKSAIASSTSIKYAGGLGFTDRRWLAREMETTPEFIAAQKKDGGANPKWTKFAVYVRNDTESAASLHVPLLQLENEPMMTEAQYQGLIGRNTQQIRPDVEDAVEEQLPAPAGEVPAPQVVRHAIEAPRPVPKPPQPPTGKEKLW